MQVMQAYSLFRRRIDRSIIDIDVDVMTSLSGGAAWPVVAAATAALSGQLDDCVTGDDLDDAIRRFFVDYDDGLISQERFEAEIARVLEELRDWESDLWRPLAGTGAWHAG
jgi:hypothetical protein